MIGPSLYKAEPNTYNHEFQYSAAQTFGKNGFKLAKYCSRNRWMEHCLAFD